MILSLALPITAADQPESENSLPSRAKRRWGVGASLGGPGWLYTLSGDYYLTPNFNAEVGGSLLPGVPTARTTIWFSHIGLKYALLGHRPGQRWSPYISAVGAMMLIRDEITFSQLTSSSTVVSSTERVSVPFFWLYVPVGIELIAFNGFTFGAEIGYVYAPTQKRTINSEKLSGAYSTVEISNTASVWLALRFGYHF